MVEDDDGTQTDPIESKGRQALVEQSEDRVDVSACGIVQEERADDRAHAGVEEGIAKRAGIRDEDADVLH